MMQLNELIRKQKDFHHMRKMTSILRVMSINIKGKLMKKSSEVISSKVYCQKSVELEENDFETIKREPDT